MSARHDPMLVRLKPLPPRLRVAHLAALLRCAAEGTPREAELTRLLLAQSTECPTRMNGGHQDGR